MTDATAETPVTGHATVDAAMARVSALGEQPLSDHVTAFDEAHGMLRRALTETADDAESAGAEPEPS